MFGMRALKVFHAVMRRRLVRAEPAEIAENEKVSVRAKAQRRKDAKGLGFPAKPVFLILPPQEQ